MNINLRLELSGDVLNMKNQIFILKNKILSGEIHYLFVFHFQKFFKSILSSSSEKN